MSEETDDQFANDKSIWSLTFMNEGTQFFITFYISEIIVSGKEKWSFKVEGTIQKNRAVLVQECLYFVSKDNDLYCIKNVLDESQVPQNINKKLKFKVDYLTISKNRKSAIILTTNQYIYFATSNGEIKLASKNPLRFRVSFIKDFGNEGYVGVIQNKLYKFDKEFQCRDQDEQNEFSIITDIFGEIDNAIIIGYSKSKSVSITKGKIFRDSNQSNISHVVANYESFYILQNKIEEWQPSYAIVSESEIILFNSELHIISKKPITKTDFLVSSFILDNNDDSNDNDSNNNPNKLFIHFSKSGLHSYTLYNTDCQITDENKNEILFYYAFLFEKAKEYKCKQKFVSSFYEKVQQLTKEEKIGKIISQMEMNAFEERKSEWSYNKIMKAHNCLIRMMSCTDNAEEIVPFLNTNTIYLRLIYNCANDDNLFQFSTFGKLHELIDSKNFTIRLLPLLLESINESIELTLDDFRGIFDGYDNLYQLINDLLFKNENNSLERFQLIECKYKLTKEFSIKDVNINDLETEIDKYEEFALKHGIIDILYEIIKKTSDFKRAKKYSKIQNLDILYNKFSSNPDIKRKLAILQGWESLDKFVSYDNGLILDSESSQKEQISANTLALLCSSLIDNQEEEDQIESAIENLKIQIFPSLT